MMGRREVSRHLMARRRMAIFFVTAALVLGGALLGSGAIAASRSEASMEHGSSKYYASIQIQQGDTLWGIASAYRSPEYGSIRDYIDEVKELNQLRSDEIHAGQFLIVPYFRQQ